MLSLIGNIVYTRFFALLLDGWWGPPPACGRFLHLRVVGSSICVWSVPPPACGRLFYMRVVGCSTCVWSVHPLFNFQLSRLDDILYTHNVFLHINIWLSIKAHMQTYFGLVNFVFGKRATFPIQHLVSRQCCST